MDKKFEFKGLTIYLHSEVYDPAEDTFLLIDALDIKPDDFVCSVCHSSICVTDNGDVYPCAGWQGYIVGNVNHTSLNDIWDNSEKVRYLRGLRKHDFPKCIKCLDKDFCTMCMVRNANENPLGDPLKVNEYFCNIAKLNREMCLNLRKS